MKKASLYKKLPDDSVECTACAFRCKIAKGRAGICSVRKNIDGDLHLLVWGNVSDAHIDPIEKKPLYHFLPNSKIFSIGTIGCNFKCSFCQNWQSTQLINDMKKRKPTLLDNPDFEISNYGYDLKPQEIVDYCLKNDIQSIAFTYNEPTIFAEYAKDTMKLAKKQGLYGVFVSNGFETEEALDFLEGSIDAFNIDLKSFREEFYRKVCKAKLAPVLDTIKSIHKRGKWLEITTLIIPDENDSKQELTQIAEFIAGISKDIPWHISAFHPDYKMKDKESTPSDTLFKALEIGRKAGLKYIYTGNIWDQTHSHTICPNCEETVVERPGFGHSISKLEKGKCPGCKTLVPGIWE